MAIDELALTRGLTPFSKGRAEYAFVLYSYGGLRIPGPRLINPEAEAKGRLGSDNGKLGTAAALFRLVEENDTVEICSRNCVYAYNNTRGGHGGMFFNNFWTPIGAWAAGEAGFKHFMKGQTRWRELYRRSDGSFNQAGRGGIGVSYAIGYVAPKKRLRILGAPGSAFGTNCPDVLKPALEAHAKREYAQCEKLIQKAIDGVVPAGDMPVVSHMLESVRILLRHFHMPGQDLVWRYVEPGRPSALEGVHATMAKCSASAMVHLGRRRNANEFCGAYGHALTFGEMRWLAHWCLVRGVNLLLPHAFYYSVRGTIDYGAGWEPFALEPGELVVRAFHQAGNSSSESSTGRPAA